MVNQTPEQIARDAIDRKLEQAGWLVQNYRGVRYQLWRMAAAALDQNRSLLAQREQ